MSFFTTKERFSPAMFNHDIQTTGVIQRFNSMLTICNKNCLNNTKPELTRGENLCIDRCTIKFFKVAGYIDELLANKMKLDQEKLDQLEQNMQPEPVVDGSGVPVVEAKAIPEEPK